MDISVGKQQNIPTILLQQLKHLKLSLFLMKYGNVIVRHFVMNKAGAAIKVLL